MARNRCTRFLLILVGIIAALVSVGCPPPKPAPPVTVQANYDVTNELTHTVGTLSSSAYFAGHASYYIDRTPPPAGTPPDSNLCVPVDFTFAGSGAYMQLVIVDTDGVMPGDTFSYSLTQTRSGAGIVQPAWTITTANPITASGPVNTFNYTFRPGDPTYPLQSSAKVEGTYTLDGVQRPMSVSLSIHTSQAISGTSITFVCTNPN